MGLPWLNNFINRLNCKFNGHGDTVVIEEYYRYQRVKNFKGTSLEKLRITDTYNEVVIHGKVKCKTCGCVFIGKVVK